MNINRRIIILENGFKIEILTFENRFLGIGEVRAGDIKIRSGKRPMFVDIQNPGGIALCEYNIEAIKAEKDTLIVDCSVKAKAGGMMEWMLHAVRNRYNTSDWTKEPETVPGTHFRMEIRTAGRTIGEHQYEGFSYQYFYSSKGLPIYKILDRGTWEIGGEAQGNEFWMRDSFAPSIMRFKSSTDSYSTEWYLESCENPNIFQFMPLQTALQGFTFTAADEGVLVTWPSKVAHVRSLFEKKAGINEIEHWHQHCGDLSDDFATAPVEVLWCKGCFDAVDRANLYEDVKNMVYEELHSQAGIRRERVTTYAMVEEWTPADIDYYTEQGVPKLLEAGIKTIGLSNHFENNMNTWGVGNMCCNVDYKFAESVGRDKIKGLCDRAKEGGSKVEMWGNTAISTLTLLFDNKNGNSERIKFLPQKDSIAEELKKTENPWVRTLNGAIDADHYTPSFAVLNLRDGVVRDYWLKRWKKAHDEVGIEGIFLDSSCNLSSDKFSYIQNAEYRIRGGLDGGGATMDQTQLLGRSRPEKEPPSAILSQYHAHLALVSEMQKMGYIYNCEDIGVFGIHRTGPDVTRRLDNLHLWGECICEFDVQALKQAGADLEDVFFKGLAYRMMWFIFWNIDKDMLSLKVYEVRGDFDMPTDWQIGLLKIFNRVNDIMLERKILPDEQGVLYTNGSRQVLWAFEDFGLPLGQTGRVQDLTRNTLAEGSHIHAEKHHVYVIDDIATV